MQKKILWLLLAVAVSSLAAQEFTGPVEGEIVLEKSEPYMYVAVEMKGSYDQHEQAFATLYEQGSVQGLSFDDYPMGLYYSNPMDTPEDSLIWEIGTKVSGVDSVQLPLVLKKFPYTLTVAMAYTGGFSEEMASSYAKIYEWIGQNGYQQIGPLQEIYLSIPQANAEGEWVGEVKIVIPVSKTE